MVIHVLFVYEKNVSSVWRPIGGVKKHNVCTWLSLFMSYSGGTFFVILFGWEKVLDFLDTEMNSVWHEKHSLYCSYR